MIKLSLLESSARSGSIYDLIIDQEGSAKVVAVGGGGGNISDVYHQIQTHAYKEDCSGVMVTGKDPLPEWKPTGWLDVLTGSEIFSVQDMVDNCNVENFRRYATISWNGSDFSCSWIKTSNGIIKARI